MSNTKGVIRRLGSTLLSMLNIKLSLVTFLLTAFTTWSQVSMPSISSVDHNEFTGKAVLEDENGRGYPITIHFSLFEGSSDFHAFSVEGWYYYDRYKTKIPLVGILDYNGLVLFNFKDDTKMKQVLYVNDNAWNDWEWKEFIDKRRNMDGFNEKFDFSNQEWLSGDKSLHFKVENDHRLTNHEEYLILNTNDSILLPKNHWEYQILSQNNDKFILKYSHPSMRDQFEGWCHLGWEEGFMELEIRDDLFVESNDYLIESCIQSVETRSTCKETTQLTGNGEHSRDIIFYHIESGSRNSNSVLMVDLDSCNIQEFISQ